MACAICFIDDDEFFFSFNERSAFFLARSHLVCEGEGKWGMDSWMIRTSG